MNNVLAWRVPLAAPATLPSPSESGFKPPSNSTIVFRDGMALVERTAAYLDGPGRAAVEASAGLRQRPLRRREHAAHDAAAGSRLLASDPPRAASEATSARTTPRRNAERSACRRRPGRRTYRASPSLPEALQNLMTESYALHDRIVRLDRALSDQPRRWRLRSRARQSGRHADRPPARRLQPLNREDR